ncbi:hypothetical protein [uncultured Rhodoblastus sp.]|uniref:hypothetical protein n=1 Tax=uncultured Rhodoblastus sp. TaxID=543037 RepID=UPI0025F271DB|nr:hypothetical protein [uncultured Rhodoblastus sp.]
MNAPPEIQLAKPDNPSPAATVSAAQSHPPPNPPSDTGLKGRLFEGGARIEVGIDGDFILLRPQKSIRHVNELAKRRL